MKQDKILKLIQQIKEEIASSDKDDQELLDIVDQLEADIEKKDQSTDSDNMNDTILALEARLNADHPVTTRVIEELINILAKIGI